MATMHNTCYSCVHVYFDVTGEITISWYKSPNLVISLSQVRGSRLQVMQNILTALEPERDNTKSFDSTAHQRFNFYAPKRIETQLGEHRLETVWAYWPIRLAIITSLFSMNQVEIFLLLPTWNASLGWITPSTAFISTPIYDFVEKKPVWWWIKYRHTCTSHALDKSLSSGQHNNYLFCRQLLFTGQCFI